MFTKNVLKIGIVDLDKTICLLRLLKKLNARLFITKVVFRFIMKEFNINFDDIRSIYNAKVL